MFVPSDRNLAIRDWVRSSKPGQALVVNAGPGSGKSATGVWIINDLPYEEQRRTGFLAFAKDIAEAMKRKLPAHVMCKTGHSFGRGDLAAGLRGKSFLDGWNAKLDTYKYQNLVELYWLRRDWSISDNPAYDAMPQLINFARLTLVDTSDDDALTDMCIDREISIPADSMTACFAALREILAIGSDAKGEYTGAYKDKFGKGFGPYEKIDFTDMLWLPVVLNLPAVDAIDNLVVDEAQDLSPLLMETALRHWNKRGWLLVVGDRRQAIYGFAGAAHDSIDRIKERVGNADELPLDICYRCPVSVINNVNRHFPNDTIVPAPGAIEGIVANVPMSDFDTRVRPGDMVLCRTTAPLVSLALRMIREGRRVRIRGKDIGAELRKIINALLHPRPGVENDIRDLGHLIDKWASDRCESINRRFDDNRASQLCSVVNDKADCLHALCDGVIPLTVEGVKSKCDTLFGNDPVAGEIVLSTMHRAKGLEADVVWLIRYDLCPHKMAKTSKSRVQEKNLQWVAESRAMKALYIVNENSEDVVTLKQAQELKGQQSRWLKS